MELSRVMERIEKKCQEALEEIDSYPEEVENSKKNGGGTDWTNTTYGYGVLQK